MGRIVILTGSWDAATRARAVAVASGLSAAGVDTGVVAPPEADVMALFGKIDGSGMRAVAAAQYGDFHE